MLIIKHAADDVAREKLRLVPKVVGIQQNTLTSCLREIEAVEHELLPDWFQLSYSESFVSRAVSLRTRVARSFVFLSCVL